MSEHDTICAVSTPPGEGGIGIIRVSGPDAVRIAALIFRPRGSKDLLNASTHSMLFGHVHDPAMNDVVDEALVSVMRAPATYTREDVVEINCHGGMAALARTMGLLLAFGARQAEPGEFTKRAFLNGRIDLVQAEAVMDVIRAKTEMSLRAANEQLSGELSRDINALRTTLIGIAAQIEAAVDFPEEEIETASGNSVTSEIDSLLAEVARILEGFTFGRIVRQGLATAIVGRPNVGKSSLLNALLRQNRAIVTDTPGTTRDVIEESMNISGIPVRIVDTAGIRDTHDMVEQEGVKRSIAAIRSADLVLVVLDGSSALHEGDRRVLQEVRGMNTVAVMNKADRPRQLETIEWPPVQVPVSCVTGQGLDELKNAITGQVMQGKLQAGEHAWAVNMRHKTALEQAGSSLRKARESAQANLSPEFISLDLRDALDSIGLIIGATYTEDILERIFSDFCIGK